MARLILIVLLVFPAVAFAEPFKQRGDVVTGGTYEDTDEGIRMDRGLRTLRDADRSVRPTPPRDCFPPSCVKSLKERAEEADKTHPR